MECYSIHAPNISRNVFESTQELQIDHHIPLLLLSCMTLRHVNSRDSRAVLCPSGFAGGCAGPDESDEFLQFVQVTVINQMDFMCNLVLLN